jgi:hypothetical protein
MADGDNDQNHHIQYIHFMIGQLQDIIKYADTKHALGMSFVMSILFASNEFIFKKVGHSSVIDKELIKLSLIFAFFAIGAGFFGIFPRFVTPYLVSKRSSSSLNIFYFAEIATVDAKFLEKTISKTFPNSTLNPAYQESGILEIQALSLVVTAKMRLFKWFMYSLCCYLICISILFWRIT